MPTCSESTQDSSYWSSWNAFYATRATVWPKPGWKLFLPTHGLYFPVAEMFSSVFGHREDEFIVVRWRKGSSEINISNVVLRREKPECVIYSFWLICPSWSVVWLKTSWRYRCPLQTLELNPGEKLKLPHCFSPSLLPLPSLPASVSARREGEAVTEGLAKLGCLCNNSN